MLVIALPVFNEETGISGFLNELYENLNGFSPYFVVVDDKSTDSTNAILSKMQTDGFPITTIQNKINKGHGFSVIAGIKKAIELRPKSILICDGDGQFHGADVRILVESQFRNTNSIIEGVRTHRNDPWFRRFLSLGTRILVWVVCGNMPKDANTPLRVLSLENATNLLNGIDDDCLIPNLAISGLSRAGRFEINEIEVRSLPPRRDRDAIDHWKQKTNFLPSKRLLRFAFFATIQWMKFFKHFMRFRKSHSKNGAKC
jgi:glycosyltransferase involved in cell wall biosynthesis